MAIDTDLDALYAKAVAKMSALLDLQRTGIEYSNDGQSVSVSLDRVGNELERLRKMRASLPGRATINVEKECY